MPIKVDIQQAWKWNSSVKPKNTQPVQGKRRKIDDFTPRSPCESQPLPTQFEKMTEPFRNASNSVKGLFRRRSVPGSRYGNGKRDFGARLAGDRDKLENQVAITPGVGQLRLEDLKREFRGRGPEAEGLEVQMQQRPLADSACYASVDDVRDPFADPSREGSQLSRWSTAGSLISTTHTPSRSQLP